MVLFLRSFLQEKLVKTRNSPFVWVSKICAVPAFRQGLIEAFLHLNRGREKTLVKRRGGPSVLVLEGRVGLY